MTYATIGALIGGVFGLANFFLLQSIARKIELEAKTENSNKGAKLLRWAAWADLVIFPLIGYYVGPLVAQ